MLYKRNDGTVRINTMTIIENLPTFNADLSNNLVLRLPIRDNSIVSSLTSSIVKVVCKHKVRRNN